VEVDLWMWAAFGAFVVAMLLVDLVAFGRGQDEIAFGRAVRWSIGWTVLGVAFAGFVWAWEGRIYAEQYFAGFLIEKSLSIDNLFVFALIFSYFAVPAGNQRRVIFWGIVGAIVLRGIFILAGAALLDAFHYTIYVFGIFLIVTGIRMARHSNVEIHPEKNPALKLLQRAMPLTMRYHGDRLTAVEDGRRVATPMLAALALVATFDVVFAVDSIPAIFAVTREVFIVERVLAPRSRGALLRARGDDRPLPLLEHRARGGARLRRREDDALGRVRDPDLRVAPRDRRHARGGGDRVGSAALAAALAARLAPRGEASGCLEGLCVMPKLCPSAPSSA
jgi:tellurite resistance protein TerC